MSAVEFVRWQAFFRRNPHGLGWRNWVQAKVRQDLCRLLPGMTSKKLPKLDQFLWKRPEPLFIERTRQEHKARKRKNPK